MNPSRISITDDDGTIAASGVVDAHTAERLALALDERGTGTDVELDVGDVEFIDSSGLRVLVQAHQTLDDAGRRLVLVATSDAVDRLLELTGLEGHLHREPRM